MSRGCRSPTSLMDGDQQRRQCPGDDLVEGESAAPGVGADSAYGPDRQLKGDSDGRLRQAGDHNGRTGSCLCVRGVTPDSWGNLTCPPRLPLAVLIYCNPMRAISLESQSRGPSPDDERGGAGPRRTSKEAGGAGVVGDRTVQEVAGRREVHPNRSWSRGLVPPSPAPRTDGHTARAANPWTSSAASAAPRRTGPRGWGTGLTRSVR